MLLSGTGLLQGVSQAASSAFSEHVEHLGLCALLCSP